MGESKYPRNERAVRLSVTVPAWLAEWTRAEAKANGVPISTVVATAVRRKMEATRDET